MSAEVQYWQILNSVALDVRLFQIRTGMHLGPAWHHLHNGTDLVAGEFELLPALVDSVQAGDNWVAQCHHFPLPWKTHFRVRFLAPQELCGWNIGNVGPLHQQGP